jgi:chemotaxis-related protein WspD
MTRLFSSPAAQLLDREIPSDYRQEWTRVIAAEQPARATSSQSVLVFRIAAEWLALPTNVVQEIAENCLVHKLPHRSTGILKGIVNVRGEILLRVGLEALLGLECPADSITSADRVPEQRLLVCNRNGDRLAFLVHEVHGVHRYLPTDVRDVPATLARADAAYASGILRLKGDRTIGLLDDELVFYALNKGFA